MPARLHPTLDIIEALRLLNLSLYQMEDIGKYLKSVGLAEQRHLEKLHPLRCAKDALEIELAMAEIRTFEKGHFFLGYDGFRVPRFRYFRQDRNGDFVFSFLGGHFLVSAKTRKVSLRRVWV